MSDDKKGKKDDHNTEEVVEGAEGAVAEGEEGGKKLPVKKIVLFGVLPVVLIIALGVGAYFMGFLDHFFHKAEADCTSVKEGDEHYEECVKKITAEASGEAQGVFVDIPDMIVNLTSMTKKPSFLKIKLKIELAKPEDQKTFETMLPRVVDQFQTYLRELRIEDLRGSSGMYRMKIELLSRVKAAVPGVEVRDVLFQEILVQ